MASVNFSNGKHKGAVATKAQFRHSLTDERMKCKHKNGDIDLTRTHLNFSLYELGYQELCDKYDNRINALDSTTNDNKRKDRVTCFCLDVPAPKDLREQDCRVWFRMVANIMKEQYGNDNLLEMVVHLDEKHIYKDPVSGEDVESRTHAHCYFTPEHDGKINGKWFSSRGNINKLNNSIQAMTLRDFGIQFMDGSKKKSTDKVEDLKAKSLREEVKDLQTIKSKLKADNRELDSKICLKQDEYDKLQQSVASLEAEISDLKSQAEKYPKELSEALKNVSDASEAYNKATAKILQEEPYLVRFAKGVKDKEGNSMYDKYKASPSYTAAQRSMQQQQEQLSNQQRAATRRAIDLGNINQASTDSEELSI